MPRTLLTNNPALVLFLALFVAGAALFVLGTWFLRASRRGAPTAEASWTYAVTQTPVELSRDERIELIERLAIVGQTWCMAVLREAAERDSDPVVTGAAERAVLMIGARES